MTKTQEANARRLATMWTFNERPDYECWRDASSGDAYELWSEGGEVVKVCVNGEELEPND